MVSPYAPEIVPSDLSTPEKIQEFLKKEFDNIAKAMDRAVTVTLDPQFSAVAKPEEGIIVYADGVSWNPGEGEGYYGYTNGVYVKLSNASGGVVDSVIASYTANANITTIIPLDDTIPTSTEGDQILSVAITPKSITNKLRCRFSGFAAQSVANGFSVAMFQGSTCIDVVTIGASTINFPLPVVLEAEYVPGVLTAQTISVRAGPQGAATIRFNGTSAARFYGGAANATLVVEEIKV